jgi:HemY protein
VKRIGLWLLIALLAGGAIGALVARDPGYVLVSYANTTLETSLWVFGVLLFAFYAIVRGIAYATRRILHGPADLGEWNRTRRERSALDRTSTGLLMMAEGRWEAARKELIAAAANAHTPLVNYLHAARAAHSLGDREQTTELLDRAREAAGADTLPVELTAAELELDEGRPSVATQRLNALPKDVLRRPAVLRVLARAYEAAGDDAALRALLPDLRATKLVAEEELTRLRRLAWTPPGTTRVSTERLAADWKALSKSEREDPQSVAGYAQTLMTLGDADAAEALLRHAVSQTWDDALVDLYGELRASDSEHQLRVAEGWLRQHAQSGALLRTLGKITVRRGEAAKAREYFETSLRFERSGNAYRELARLCIASGEGERGAEYLTQADALQ